MRGSRRLCQPGSISTPPQQSSRRVCSRKRCSSGRGSQSHSLEVGDSSTSQTVLWSLSICELGGWSGSFPPSPDSIRDVSSPLRSASLRRSASRKERRSDRLCLVRPQDRPLRRISRLMPRRLRRRSGARTYGALSMADARADRASVISHGSTPRVIRQH